MLISSFLQFGFRNNSPRVRYEGVYFPFSRNMRFYPLSRNSFSLNVVDVANERRSGGCPSASIVPLNK